MSLKLTKKTRIKRTLTLWKFECLVSHAESSRKDFECITTGYPLRDYKVCICSDTEEVFLNLNLSISNRIVS